MKRYLIQISHRPPRSPSKAELEIALLTVALLLLIFGGYVLAVILGD